MSYAERDRLLEALPKVFRRDPRPVPTLSLGYLGAGKLALDIQDGLLTLQGIEGAPSATVDLETGLTFAELVTVLNGVTNYAAVLVDPAAAAVRAITLVEESHQTIVGTNTPEFSDEFAIGDFAVEGAATLGRFTNPLWLFLEPIRREVKRKAVTLDVALAQLNLLTSAGFFADYWGRHTVTTRRPSEGDGPYTARQRHELLRPRENNFALATLIEEDTGAPVLEVADLYPEVFRLNRSHLNRHRFAGHYYNAATCEVRLEGFPTTAVIDAARAHVACGITIFVRGQKPLAAPIGGYTLTSTPLDATPPPAMKIGETPIGVGKIG